MRIRLSVPVVGIHIAVFVLLIFLTVSCTPSKTSPPQSATITAPLVKSEVKVGWEAEWDKTLEKGRKEGRVTLYSTLGSEVRNALVEAFPKATGINLDMVSGRSNETTQKITTEKHAGLHMVDVFSGGPNSMFELKSKGFLQPMKSSLILPEVKDPNMWFQKKLPFIDINEDTIFAFRANPGGYTVMINTNYVKKTELTSFYDLLNPKWKGKIIMDDVTSTGSGQKWVMMGMLFWGLNWDFMRQIVKQEPYMLRNERQQVEWLVHGKYPIGMTPSSDVAAEFRQAGAPILEIAMKEEIQYISTGGGNAALVDKAPHPNAAKIFINWLLSKEGQTIFSRARLDASARNDVPTDHLPAYRVRDPKAEYLQVDIEKIQTDPKWFETTATVKEIFSPLLK